jgi:hypothetical protein
VNIVLPPKGKCDARYVCGDRRLGPVEPPKEGRLASILRSGYERLKSSLPYLYLKKYWDKATNKWLYPPHDGFALKDDHLSPDAVEVVLTAGIQVDRFGSPHGSYLAPAGASFDSRAIPFESLSEDLHLAKRGLPTPPYNYYIYEVVKPFKVLAGPIAPHFGAHDCGFQYYTNLTSVGGVDRNVQKLLDDKFLKDITFLED